MDANFMPNDWDVLLSCYFDGELSPEEEASLFIELERSNELQVRFNKMKTLRDALNKTIEKQTDSSDTTTSTVWHSILEKLNQPSDSLSEDLAPTTLSVHSELAEIASSYHDGELSGTEIAEFETVLSNDQEAGSLLKQFGQISEALERVAATCSIDVSAQVMAQLFSEMPQEEQNSELEFAQIELLSAHVDNELKTQEVIQLNHLIENSMQAKQQLHTLNTLHDLIQTAHRNTASTLQVDLWSKIESQLQSDNKVASINAKKNQGKLVPLNKAIWLGAPMAAAAALLVLSWPTHQLDSLVGTDIALSSNPAPTQIASVPKFRNMNLSRLSSNGESLPMIPVVPVVNKAQNSNQAPLQARVILVPTKPILDATARQLASRRVGTKTDATAAFKNKASKKAPSSEEYLFHALDEQGAGNDFSNLLND